MARNALRTRHAAASLKFRLTASSTLRSASSSAAHLQVHFRQADRRSLRGEPAGLFQLRHGLGTGVAQPERFGVVATGIAVGWADIDGLCQYCFSLTRLLCSRKSLPSLESFREAVSEAGTGSRSPAHWQPTHDRRMKGQKDRKEDGRKENKFIFLSTRLANRSIFLSLIFLSKNRAESWKQTAREYQNASRPATAIFSIFRPIHTLPFAC